MSLLLSFKSTTTSVLQARLPLPYSCLKIEEGEGLIPPPWRRINNGRLRREQGGMMGEETWKWEAKKAKEREMRRSAERMLRNEWRV